MKDSIYLQIRKYEEMFGKEIPNEPNYPTVILNDEEKFELMLKKSVAEKKDYLTEAYGEGWNLLDINSLY